MSCCNKITDILKGILKAIGPILTIALLAFAAYMIIFEGPLFMSALQGFVGILPEAILGLEAATYGYIALGAAVIVDASTGGEMIGSIVTGVAKVAGKIIAGVAGGVATGLFGPGGLSNLLLYGSLGLLAYWFIVKRKDDEDPAATLGTAAKRLAADKEYTDEQLAIRQNLGSQS